MGFSDELLRRGRPLLEVVEGACAEAVDDEITAVDPDALEACG